MKCFVVSLFISVFLSTVAYAGTGDSAPSVVFPSIPALVQTKAGFVPKGWTVEKESDGDLNGDGHPEAVAACGRMFRSVVLCGSSFPL